MTTWHLSHGVHAYVAHRQGVVSLNGHSLGMDYVIQSLDTWALLGVLECRLGIGCITLRA